MTVPEVIHCPNGYFLWAIYGLGPYIADYPEQVLLSFVVQGCCPRYTLICFDFNLSKSCIHRCRAPRDNLDIVPDQGWHSHEHTDLLVKTLELGVLWDEFGIVGNVIVSPVYKVPHLRHSYSFLAIFKQFPESGHTWTNRTGPSPPNHQRYIQGPPHWLGQRISFHHSQWCSG